MNRIILTQDQVKTISGLLIEKKKVNLFKKKGNTLKKLSNLDGYVDSGLMMVGEEKGNNSIDISERNGNLSDKKLHEYKKYLTKICKYMNTHGLTISPYPKFILDSEEQDGLFIKTGYYAPNEKEVVVFVNDRHIKDCLRSICHELVHHAQNLRGENMNFTNNDNVKDNKKLEKLESEAYLKGNIYFRKWTEYFKKTDKQALNEAMSYNDAEMAELFTADDIDLSSFKIKRELNPKFWKDGHLDSRIRMKLLDIAEDFIDFMGIDWVEPEDIIMTGSLANYNWNKKYSDIDLHIIINYSDVDERTEFVENYFYSQKELWNKEHEDIKIFGFPVEVYVENAEERNGIESGIYSVQDDKWVEKPNRKHLSGYKNNKPLIRKKIAYYMNKIDEIEDEFNDAEGNIAKEKKILKKAELIWKKVVAERRNGFAKEPNEMANGNLVFKALRRRGYADKITKLQNKVYTHLHSL